MRDEMSTEPRCDPLPSARPAGAVMRVGRVDGASLTTVFDVALVADAACPTAILTPSPACVKLTGEAMDYIWAKLVAVAPHRIAMEGHGECIHCGGSWIAIEWPRGQCERGSDHFHDVADASQDRFDRAVQALTVAASAGGIEATAPIR